MPVPAEFGSCKYAAFSITTETATLSFNPSQIPRSRPWVAPEPAPKPRLCLGTSPGPGLSSITPARWCRSGHLRTGAGGLPSPPASSSTQVARAETQPHALGPSGAGLGETEKSRQPATGGLGTPGSPKQGEAHACQRLTLGGEAAGGKEMSDCPPAAASRLCGSGPSPSPLWASVSSLEFGVSFPAADSKSRGAAGVTASSAWGRGGVS